MSLSFSLIEVLVFVTLFFSLGSVNAYTNSCNEIFNKNEDYEEILLKHNIDKEILQIPGDVDWFCKKEYSEFSNLRQSNYKKLLICVKSEFSKLVVNLKKLEYSDEEVENMERKISGLNDNYTLQPVYGFGKATLYAAVASTILMDQYNDLYIEVREFVASVIRKAICCKNNDMINDYVQYYSENVKHCAATDKILNKYFGIFEESFREKLDSVFYKSVLNAKEKVYGRSCRELSLKEHNTSSENFSYLGIKDTSSLKQCSNSSSCIKSVTSSGSIFPEILYHLDYTNFTCSMVKNLREIKNRNTDLIRLTKFVGKYGGLLNKWKSLSGINLDNEKTNRTELEKNVEEINSKTKNCSILLKFTENLPSTIKHRFSTALTKQNKLDLFKKDIYHEKSRSLSTFITFREDLYSSDLWGEAYTSNNYEIILQKAWISLFCIEKSLYTERDIPTAYTDNTLNFSENQCDNLKIIISHSILHEKEPVDNLYKFLQEEFLRAPSELLYKEAVTEVKTEWGLYSFSMIFINRNKYNETKERMNGIISDLERLRVFTDKHKKNMTSLLEDRIKPNIDVIKSITLGPNYYSDNASRETKTSLDSILQGYNNALQSKQILISESAKIRENLNLSISNFKKELNDTKRFIIDKFKKALGCIEANPKGYDEEQINKIAIAIQRMEAPDLNIHDNYDTRNFLQSESVIMNCIKEWARKIHWIDIFPADF